MIKTEQKVNFSSGFSMELGNITPCGPLSTNTETKMDLIQIAYYPTDSCTISPLAFLFKIPVTHSQSMFLLCKLFSMTIHIMGYFCDIMTLHVDEWKLTCLCPSQLGHCIIYFCSTLKSFVTSQLSYML